MMRVLLLLLLLCLPLMAQPPSARNKFKIGRGFFSKGRYVQAVDYFNQALAEDPTYLDALYMLGLSYFGQKNYAKAEEQLQVVMRRDPQFLEAYQYLGQVYIAQKKYDQAIGHFQKMSSLPGVGTAAQYCLGVVYYQQKNLTMAEKAWQEAVRLDRNDARSHNNLGVLRRVQGKHVEALTEFQLATRLSPENPSYLLNVAVEQIYLKHLEQARAQLQRVDKLSGQRLDIGAVGAAYLARLDGKWEKVLEYTTRALSENDEQTQALLLKAEALEHLKRNDEAVTVYQQALESDPNVKEAEEALSRLKDNPVKSELPKRP